MKPSHLYIHAPFCARRCSYCDFAVTVMRRPDANAWVDAVERELAGVLRRRGWDRLALLTVYVGGGTPSLLGPAAMVALRSRLERHADLAPDLEWTAEANPESFTTEVAENWREAGVTRLSLGAQTFHEPALRWMGRLHGAEGPGRALETARSSGFDNVSLDLIFGLPERLGRDWGGDLQHAIALGPEHVSLYGLTAEEGTPLGRWVAAGREVLADEERYADEFLLAAERLPAAGLEHYEVSSFGRAGRRSRHNSAYWTGRAYLGLGPGAHSYVPPRRWWNERAWARYEGAVRETGSAEVGHEDVEGETARLERIWLALRTAEGMAASQFSAAALHRVGEWWQNGWADVDAGRVRLTPRGWLLLDRLALELAGADAERGASGALALRPAGADDGAAGRGA